MTVNFQYVDISPSESLNTYTKEKLNKLFDKYEFLISAEVHFKINRKEHDKGKICTIKLSLPGPQIFASSDESNYKLAAKKAVSELEVQLEKRKATFHAH